MSLQFVEREELSPVTADGRLLPNNTMQTVKRRVLQQNWTDTYGHSEWRDVPLKGNNMETLAEALPKARNDAKAYKE